MESDNAEHKCNVVTSYVSISARMAQGSDREWEIGTSESIYMKTIGVWDEWKQSN